LKNSGYHHNDQHAYLFGILVACASIVKNEKKHTPQKMDSEIKEVLEELLHYTKMHFSYEEKIMEKTEYPEIEQHKNVHKAFFQKTIELQTAFTKKKDHKYEVGLELITFIKNWYFEHVATEDKKIVAHVKEVEARTSHK